jgi:hypothetical protein
VTDENLEVAALVDLTDDLQQTADVESTIPVGGCLSLGLIMIVILVWWTIS